MKFSVRQILASAAGAVIAAVIASTFGVKGTIVGVAIGSVAATMGTALVAQSIDRGHKAVRQVVRAPESSPLLRRLGSTGIARAGSADADADARAPTEAVASAHDPTAEMTSTAAPAEETRRFEVRAASDAPATERLAASATPAPPASRRPGGPTGGSRRFSWRMIAGTAGIVFVIALVFITAVELISGQPLSAIFGGPDSGTTLHNIVSPSAPPASTTTTSTVPGTSTTTSTTTGASTSTTSTTAPRATSTTAATTSTTSTTTTTTGGPGSSKATTTTSAATSP